jgi:hypothetical protein
LEGVNQLRYPTILLVTVLLGLSPAVAEEGGDAEPNCWPGEPGTDQTLCPPDDPGFSRRWEFRSDIPPEIDRSKMHPSELELGAIGFSVDRAWQRTTGRDDVLIAVLDSGIRWRHRDLVEKLHLNAGELPKPQGAEAYDANGDGIFNILDYHGDPRVGDRNGNGQLDPEDLILVFSDCRDDDRNGYPDDISGYDFFSGGHCGYPGADNNPGDATDFGHGSGIAGAAATQTNNGVGDPGVCPGCRILPVRVGDSFVVDANQFAEGLVYATRAGATVVASALGSYNNTPTARAAVDHAYANGVTLIASAADEFSYHHNYPSTYNHALYVNAIRFNHANDYREASTFFGLSPCTNFGARVWVTVPARSCSSGATSRLSGVAGLIHSAALDAGHGPLHPEEVYQLIRATADDLDNSEPDWGPARYPARAGFDQLSGYGRINAWRAVEAAHAGQIPPIVDLDNPRWFSVVSPKVTSKLPVTGNVRIRRARGGRYELAYAQGVEPAEAEFAIVAQGEVGHELSGLLGTLDFAKLPLPGGPPPRNRDERDRFSVTLRLRVTDDRGLTSEARRSFFVYDDPAWVDGFPHDLAASGEAAPSIVDLDGDGRDEIVLPTADGLLQIVRLTPDGIRRTTAPLDERPATPSMRTHWKAASLRRETVVRGAAIGDVDDDGAPEIVVASRSGKVYLFERDGSRVAPFPVTLDRRLAAGISAERVVESGILTRPVLAQLDGKPGLEIVVAALDGHVYAWQADGKLRPGFPVRLGPSKISSTPAVGDVDGDGRPEIVVGSNELNEGQAGVYAIRADGNAHPEGAFLNGWAPYELVGLRADLLPTIASGIHMTPGLVDADGDGDSEAVLYAVTGTRVVLVDHRDGQAQQVRRFSLSPSADSALNGMSFIGGTGSPLLADTDKDGVHELYASLLPFRMLTLRSKPGIPIDVPLVLGGWELAGAESPAAFAPTFPRRMEDLMIWARPSAADVDGDGVQEILMGSGGYLLHAFARAGGEPEGFPKFTGGWIFSPPVVGDLDGDGRGELVTVTREGYLFAWQLEASPEQQAKAVKERPPAR